MKRAWQWARTADIDPFSPEKSMIYLMWWTVGIGTAAGFLIAAAVRFGLVSA